MTSAVLILVVDERERGRQSLASELCAEGYLVAQVSTPRGALRIIEQQRPDLVVAAEPSAQFIEAALACSSCGIIVVGERGPSAEANGQVHFVRRSADLVPAIRSLCHFPKQHPETD